MKPKNFPAKINARRIRAVIRAMNANDSVTALNTEAKILSDPRSIRTKKYRVGTRKAFI